MRLRVAACLAHAVEGDARRHQLPAHDAEAPHVALFRVAVPQQHLRRRPLHRSHARHRRSAHALARQPEVRHLHPGTGRRAEQRRHAGPKEGPQRATCTPPSAETSRFCDFRSRWMIAGSRPCRYCASERGGGGGWGGAINRARLGGVSAKGEKARARSADGVEKRLHAARAVGEQLQREPRGGRPLEAALPAGSRGGILRLARKLGRAPEATASLQAAPVALRGV